MRRSLGAALLGGAIALGGADVAPRAVSRRASGTSLRSACRMIGKEPLSLELGLRAAAFPGSQVPDATVHVPPGFDPTRGPGIVLYFHGWRGCAASSLAPDDVPCEAGGPPRTASNLASQIDDAHVNAILVAVELRIDMPTGEPGTLAMPGGLRALFQELLGERLVPALGCALDVNALDRVVMIAHSGGYQAAAAALRWGDVPQITEVALLDALYGARDLFDDWIADAAGAVQGAHTKRFVDLYTCCGGTDVASRALAASARLALGGEAARALHDDDTAGEPTPEALAHDLVFQRVPRAHDELPRAYAGAIVAAAGFTPIRAPPAQ